MASTKWINGSDENNRDWHRFDGRADSVVWLAERLDESARLSGQGADSSPLQSFAETLEAPASSRLVPVAARRWLAAALLAVGLLALHLIVG